MRFYQWCLVSGIVACGVILSAALIKRTDARSHRPETGLYRIEARLDKIEKDIGMLRERLDSELFFGPVFEDDVISEDRMERALDMLRSSDPVAQYRAGRTLRGYGDLAVPPIADALRTGEAGSSYAFVLTSISGQTAGDAIRDLTCEMLREGGDDRTVALLLGELARRRDPEAQYLFRMGLRADKDAVKLAAVSGIRRMGDIDALPDLIHNRAETGSVVRREMDRAVHGFLIADPEGFFVAVETLEPRERFDIVRLMLANPGREQRGLLEKMADDPDPRVSAAALRGLEIIARRDAAAAASDSPADVGRDDPAGAIRELLEDIVD